MNALVKESASEVSDVALLVMRTYALCDQSARVLFALLSLVAAGGGVGLVSIIR